MPAHKPWYAIDSTLRDGAQVPGLVYSRSARLAIAEALAGVGLDEIEVGIPAMGAEACADIRAIRDLALPTRLAVWCRACEDDVAAAIDCAVPVIHIGMPASAIQLAACGKDWAWIEERLSRCVALARGHAELVSLGFIDASRASAAHLQRCLALAAQFAVDRVRLADSAGVWLPDQVTELLTSIRREHPDLAIGLHCHNDFGLATANCLAGLQAGACSCDVTVNGLGERAGNAALAEVALVAERAGLGSGGIDCQQLTALSRLLARCSGEELPASQPLVGSRCFSHESGIHVAAQLRDRRSFEPLDPRSIGQESQLFLGLGSGRQALRIALRAQGLACDQAQAAVFLPHLRRRARRLGRSLAAPEVGTLFRWWQQNATV